MPGRVHGRAISRAGNSPSGVPLEFSGELFFDGGISSGFYCSYLTGFNQWADISGTNGHLRVPEFVVPATVGDTAFEVNNRSVKSDHLAAGPATAQETNMIRNFANQIFSGKLNDEWPTWALKTQKVLDGCFEAAQKRES